MELILLLAYFLAIALACKRFLHTLLFTWFQIKRVTLYFLDDVFCLHFAFEAAQRIFEGLALLDTDFCQDRYTSKPAKMALCKNTPWTRPGRGNFRDSLYFRLHLPSLATT
jgi:hypothetical protein